VGTAWILAGILFLCTSASSQDPFEVVSWVDHFDFAGPSRDGKPIFDTETSEGISLILDHVQELGTTTVVWRNCAGSTMRYQSDVTSHHHDSLLDKRRIPDSRPIHGWVRYGEAEPDILREALSQCMERGLRPGVHWPFEETHWSVWTVGEFNLEHPQFWGETVDGQVWWGRLSLAHEEVMAHKLALVNELIDRGMEVLFIDFYRTGGWSPAYEYVQANRDLFRERHSEEAPFEAKEEDWCRLIAERETDLLTSIHRRFDEVDRDMELWVGIPEIAPLGNQNFKRSASDWEKWLEDGIIDGLVINYVKWDEERPWQSTRCLCQDVMRKVEGRCKVFWPVRAYDYSGYGMPSYAKATGMSQEEIASKLMTMARKAGAAGVSLECVDYGNYSDAARERLRCVRDWKYIGGTMPAPRPVSTSIQVGCYYFPGFFRASRWTPLKEYGRPLPLMGCYKDGHPGVQDWQILWAVEHGISFWIFDWYYDHKLGHVHEHNAALDQGFLRSQYRDLMDFALFWCNEGPDYDECTADQMQRMGQKLKEKYLDQPNYIRIKRAPMLVVSRPFRLLDKFGPEGTRLLLDAVIQGSGEDDFFFVANAAHRLSEFKNAGFDACTGYNYATVGVEKVEGRSASYEKMTLRYEEIWKRVHEDGSLPYIPPLSPGWDSRPWYGDRGFVRTGTTPKRFRHHLEAVKDYVDPLLNRVVIEAWNEFGEGSYIEPTEARGFGFLDAIRQAFSEKNGEEYEDLVPDDETLVFPDVPALVDELIEGQDGNLIYNPGFELECGWCTYGGGQPTYTQEDALKGVLSLLVTQEDVGIKWEYPIALDEGTIYEVSAHAKGRIRMVAALFDAQKKWLRDYVPLGESPAGVDRHSLSGTLGHQKKEVSFFNVEFVPLDGQAIIDQVEVRKVTQGNGFSVD